MFEGNLIVSEKCFIYYDIFCNIEFFNIYFKFKVMDKDVVKISISLKWLVIFLVGKNFNKYMLIMVN